MSTKAVTQSTNVQAHDYLQRISLILMAAGIIVSGYLSYVKAAGTEMVCVEGGAINCNVVQHSIYSQFMGIEIAYLGLATYLLLAALLLLRNRIALLEEYSEVLIFGITLFAWLYSMWLVYAQVFLLQALCPWCLAHEIIMTLLFIVSALRLRQALTNPV